MNEFTVVRFFEIAKTLRQCGFPDLFFGGMEAASPLRVQTSERARYVRFRVNSGECLHLENVVLTGLGWDGLSRNLSESARISVSSVYAGTEHLLARRCLVDPQHRGIGIHTDMGGAEWILLDIGYSAALTEILVRNREDVYAPRAWSLIIECSDDLLGWKSIYSHAARVSEFNRMLGQAFDFHHELDRQLCERLYRIVASAPSLGDPTLEQEVRQLECDEPSVAALITAKLNSDFFSLYRLRLTCHGVVHPFMFCNPEEKSSYLQDSAQILSVLKALSPDVCFGFGFVLGCVRDNDLIPHDDDVDLLVALSRDDYPTLTYALRKVEKVLTAAGYTVTGDHLFSHRWVSTADGRATDVFVGLHANGRVSWFPSARDNFAMDDVFPPVPVSLHGVCCPVPKIVMKYLEVTYGPSWRQPDTSFEHPGDEEEYSDLR